MAKKCGCIGARARLFANGALVCGWGAVGDGVGKCKGRKVGRAIEVCEKLPNCLGCPLPKLPHSPLPSAGRPVLPLFQVRP